MLQSHCLITRTKLIVVFITIILQFFFPIIVNSQKEAGAVCSKCGKYFDTYNAAVSHMCSVHGINCPQKTNNTNQSNDKDLQTEEQKKQAVIKAKEEADKKANEQQLKKKQEEERKNQEKSSVMQRMKDISTTKAITNVEGNNSGKSIGVVTGLKGDVKIKGIIDKEFRELVEGSNVFANDRVTLGSNGRLKIQLLDETILTLGPSCEMMLDQFVYEPESQTGKIYLVVYKGIFRAITGKISKKDPANMNIKLPVGTIGIRGTDFEVEILPDGNGNIKLYKGGLHITPNTHEASIDMTAGQSVDFTAAGKFQLPVLFAGSTDKVASDSLQQMVKELQGLTGDLYFNLLERIIKLSTRINPLPPIPETAREKYIMGKEAKEGAVTIKEFELSISLLKEARTTAPWWPEIYLELGYTFEMAGVYDPSYYPGALYNFEMYLLTKPSEDNTRKIQDEIYIIKAKQKKAEQKQIEDKANAEGEKLKSLIGEWDYQTGRYIEIQKMLIEKLASSSYNITCNMIPNKKEIFIATGIDNRMEFSRFIDAGLTKYYIYITLELSNDGKIMYRIDRTITKQNNHPDIEEKDTYTYIRK